MSFILDTPSELAMKIALKAKTIRLQKNLSQEGLAERSGMSLSSLKRFERTGQISFTSLLALALILDSLAEFYNLFEKQNSNLSLDEILGSDHNSRKRGRKN